MRYSSRFFLYAPVVLLLLLAAAVMIWWKIAASSFDKQLTADNGRELMPGVRMRYISKVMEGFPFRIDAVLDGFSLEVQTHTGPLTWRADRFAIHMLTYATSRQIFEAAGAQTFLWTDSAGAPRRFSFVPGSLRASAIVSDGSLARFDLDVAALNSQELTGDRVQFHLRRNPRHDALDFALAADGIHLSAALRAGFGDDIERVDIEGNVAPALALQRLLGGREDWGAAAEDWRHASGYLTVQPFQISWGKIDATGRGRLSLDAAHYLAGDLDLDIRGTDHFALRSGSDAKLAAALRSAAGALAREGRLITKLSFVGSDVFLGGRISTGKLDSLY
ncbi:MAG TPA: DUF2125 domain-containing protein [Rhizomicrobium sp.]